MLQAFTKRFCLLTVVMLLSVVNALAQDVAQIGSTKYATLEAAFAAAKDGQTIKLLADCSGNGIIVEENTFTTGLTVDFNTFTYTVNGTTLAGSTGTKNQAFQLKKGNKITFQNGAIVGNTDKVKMLIQNYSDLTLWGMTLDANQGTNSVNYVLSTNNGSTVIHHTTITAKDDGKAFDVCSGWGNYPSNSVEVTAASVINGDVEVSYLGQTPATPSVLKLTYGTLNGNIVMAQGADQCTVTKYSTFPATAPAGYYWKAGEDGFSVLVGPDVIEIGSVADLIKFREKVNEGVEYPVDGFEGKWPNGDLVGRTIKLTADLDLEGKEWTPINLKVREPGGIRTTFDGGGHTISNLTISSQPALNKGVGLFSLLEGVTLKNLTLKNVHITANYKVGAFVGAEEIIAQIDKCHLDGGTITCTPVQNDKDEYDDGNHVGGIIGYLQVQNPNSSVTNCSVKNVTIQAYRDMGSIVGTFTTGTHAASEISDCYAENVTLIQDYTIDYKSNVAPLKENCNIHEIVGRVLGTNTIENNDFENVTITAGNIANDEATIAKVEIAQEGVKNVTVSAAIGSADVTEIAAGAFESLPNTVQTIDLSSTQVALKDDRSVNPVLKDIPENVLVYLPSTSSEVTGTNVVIKDAGTQKYTCKSLLMEDQNDYSIPTPFVAKEAKLNRSFAANVASTLCLPYDVPAGNIKGKIYRFKSIDLNACTITMTEDADGLDANVPYIFMPNADTDKISASSSASDIEVKMETPQTTQGNFTFVGVFEKKEFTETECQNGIYGYAGQNVDQFTVGQFVKVGYGSKVAGMRAYLVNNGVAGAPAAPGLNGAAAATSLPSRFNVQLQNANGETTEILSLDMETTEDGSPVYNLSGQRVNNAQKGIYIKNGKKVIIK